MTVSVTPNQYYGKSGDKFSLVCESPQEPYRGISWSRRGGQALPYSSTVDAGVLTVYDAKIEDSGLYVCTVTSYSGTSGNGTANVVISSEGQG